MLRSKLLLLGVSYLLHTHENGNFRSVVQPDVVRGHVEYTISKHYLCHSTSCWTCSVARRAVCQPGPALFAYLATDDFVIWRPGFSLPRAWGLICSLLSIVG